MDGLKNGVERRISILFDIFDLLKELEVKKQKEKDEFKEYIKSIMLEVNIESVTPIDEMFKKWKDNKEKV